MRGVWTALITPFTSSNQIDLPAYRKILKDQRDAKVAGVIPCGTTGESPSLSKDEKKMLIEVALEELRGSGLGVIAGTGSNNTNETIEMSTWASDLGVDGVLVVTPYYNKPTQAGLEAHFRAVADAVKCQVVLYNVPGRTGVSLAPETVVKLASHERITALKEATGNVALTSEIMDALALENRSLSILAGDDATYLPLLSVGATGVISASSNLVPRAMVAILEAYESGNVAEARSIHQKFYPIFRDLFIESNPGPVKAALSYIGLCEPHLRLPLVPLTQASARKLQESMSRCGIASGRSL